jgi:hypothetical protein
MAKTITIKMRKNQGQALRMVLNLSARLFFGTRDVDGSSTVIWLSKDAAVCQGNRKSLAFRSASGYSKIRQATNKNDFNGCPINKQAIIS